MKKYLLMLMIPMIIGLSACGGSDDDNGGSNVANNRNELIVTGGGERNAYYVNTPSSYSSSVMGRLAISCNLYGYINLSPEQATVLSVGGISFGIIAGFSEDNMTYEQKGTIINQDNRFDVLVQMSVNSYPIPEKVYFQAYADLGGARQYGRINSISLNLPSEEEMKDYLNKSAATIETGELKHASYDPYAAISFTGYASKDDLGYNYTMTSNTWDIYTGIACSSNSSKLTTENIEQTYTDKNKKTRQYAILGGSYNPYSNSSTSYEDVYYGACNIYKTRVFKNDYLTGGTLYYRAFGRVPYYDNLFAKSPAGYRIVMGEIKSVTW